MSLLQLLTGADAPVMKPRARMEALLDRPDTAEAVQALDPVQFYDLYHDVGPSDAAVLLEYASPEQFQTCLDLDIWRGDVMDDAEMTPWVEQMLALPDEKFAEFWRETDPEILGLYLHRNVHLYISEDRSDEVDIPEGESPNVAQSPDFNYWIAYPEDTDRAEVLRQLVDRMYAVLGVEKAWSVLAAMNFDMEEIGRKLQSSMFEGLFDPTGESKYTAGQRMIKYIYFSHVLFLSSTKCSVYIKALCGV